MPAGPTGEDLGEGPADGPDLGPDTLVGVDDEGRAGRGQLGRGHRRVGRGDHADRRLPAQPSEHVPDVPAGVAPGVDDQRVRAGRRIRQRSLDRHGARLAGHQCLHPRDDGERLVGLRVDRLPQGLAELLRVLQSHPVRAEAVGLRRRLILDDDARRARPLQLLHRAGRVGVADGGVDQHRTAHRRRHLGDPFDGLAEWEAAGVRGEVGGAHLQAAGPDAVEARLLGQPRGQRVVRTGEPERPCAGGRGRAQRPIRSRLTGPVRPTRSTWRAARPGRHRCGAAGRQAPERSARAAARVRRPRTASPPRPPESRGRGRRRRTGNRPPAPAPGSPLWTNWSARPPVEPCTPLSSTT